MDFGKNLAGQGTVNSINSLAKAATINDSVQATGTGLTLTGFIKGVGSYSGSVTFAGTYSPGLSPAAVDLENLSLLETSTLLMEIGGLNAGSQYDRINVSGVAQLDGTLNVMLVPGFTPRLNDTFDLFDGQLTGNFDTINLPALSEPYFSWDTTQLRTTGVVAVVPEPGIFTLLGLAAGCLFARRKR